MKSDRFNFKFVFNHVNADEFVANIQVYKNLQNAAGSRRRIASFCVEFYCVFFWNELDELQVIIPT